jgi:2-(3-amino-3-carboxypropyl)histidine synthase
LKPTIVADPYENRAYSIESEVHRILKQRWASIQEAKKAKTFAVIVGLKNGQKRLDKALEIKEKLEKDGKTAYIFAVREIIPETLVEFPTVEAYVNTACPRTSLDEASRFKKPVLTINEAFMVFGELTWEELHKKGLFEN